MKDLAGHINEVKAAEAFTKQSIVFDRLYCNDPMIHYKRERVRDHILALQPGSSLLELNCGSGDDALFFSAQGFHVHATDISEGMLKMLESKLSTCESHRITTEKISFAELPQLRNKGPFDAVYSNFGGLNCTGELQNVLRDLHPLVKKGGTVTLVLISSFCLWEFLLLFKGKFRTAFRRFFSDKGRKAHIEGSYFTCWYYHPSFVRRHLAGFEPVSLEGLCSVVPPSYLEGFADKYPKLFEWLALKEKQLKHRWPWKYCGDYFIASFRKIS